jgi:2-oxoglutarate ferredoxin oxidoreductase subunit beta
MDRLHMMEIFRRAHDHRGSAFVEIYQNCNVFNDGAFEPLTAKSNRDDMLIPLVHGEQIRFGTDRQKGVAMGTDGSLRMVDVAEVGEDKILVHDEANDRGLGFMLSRLSGSPHEPTPIGVFRAVEHPEYGTEVAQQIARAQAAAGPGDLASLLTSGATWTVE